MHDISSLTARLRLFASPTRITHIVLYAVSAALILLAGQVGTFVDETENWGGGRAIQHGKTLYNDYATQHSPATYYVSAALLGVTDTFSFLRDLWVRSGLGFDDDIGLYRLVFACLQLASLIALHYYLRRTTIAPLFPWLVLLIAATQVSLWTQLLMAETLVAYAAVAGLLIVLFRVLPGAWNHTDLVVLALLGLLIAGASILFALLSALLYSVAWITILRQSRARARSLWLSPLLIIGIPLLYFLINSNYSAFRFYALEFNLTYYRPYSCCVSEYNWLRPFEFMLSFGRRFSMALSLALDPDYSISSGLALINLAAIALLLLRRQITPALIIAAALVLASNPRAANVGPNVDMLFHLAPYHLLTLTVLIISIHTLRQPDTPATQETHIARAVLILGAFLALPALVHTQLASFEVFFSVSDYPLDSLHSSRADRAVNLRSSTSADLKMIRDIVEDDETVWFGPYRSELTLFLIDRFASRHVLYLPWHGDSEEATNDLLNDLNRNRPVLILFNRDAQIWGIQLSEHITQFLTYLDYTYTPVNTWIGPVYVRRDIYDEMLIRLDTNGYLP